MIELPEAMTIAKQMHAELTGKRIVDVVRGASPHKFAFYGPLSEEEYIRRLKGALLGETTWHGMHTLTTVGDDHILALGGGGERILYHRDEGSIPKKHQLLLRFADGDALTVSVSGWGSVFCLTNEELLGQGHIRYGQPQPLSDAFTFESFAQTFSARAPEDKTSIKYHLISEPGVAGVGNGYLQDILFYAGIHPRRRVVEIKDRQQHKLYGALISTLQRAAELGGRDTERDLYNRPGGYARLMDTRTAGQPCPKCGAEIVKISYLGGACYLCPECQR